VTTHEVRLTAPAMIVVIELDAPPRIEVGNVTTHGEAAALQEYLDTDPLALNVRDAFYAHSQDDPLAHSRRETYTDRLDQGVTLSSLPL
jgi:hypothetical protein